MAMFWLEDTRDLVLKIFASAILFHMSTPLQTQIIALKRKAFLCAKENVQILISSAIEYCTFTQNCSRF